jgi:hypothetical protein
MLTVCLNCDYWERLDDQEGICRRRAPGIVIAHLPCGVQDLTGERARLFPAWPKTCHDDRCGEGAPLAGNQKRTPPAEIGVKLPRTEAEKIEDVRRKFGEDPVTSALKRRGELAAKILAWLDMHPGPATRKEILEGLGGNPGSLTVTLGKMKQRGQLVHANGKYSIKGREVEHVGS